MSEILGLQGLDTVQPDDEFPPLSSLFSIVCCR